ncbi:hypothetical protein ACFWP7_01820 [Streptomyces sp. NPDC058470]|uniref:hypothetical protein n=1 Tax=Streptomyces sp. NPDC058470 TaxID=3346515 RepID=UPI0036502563
MIALTAAASVLLWVLAAWKWLVRRTVPVLLEGPGGSWGFGVLSGLVSVAGGVGVVWFFGSGAASSRLRRWGRSAGPPVCACAPGAVGAFVPRSPCSVTEEIMGLPVQRPYASIAGSLCWTLECATCQFSEAVVCGAPRSDHVLLPHLAQGAPVMPSSLGTLVIYL